MRFLSNRNFLINNNYLQLERVESIKKFCLNIYENNMSLV